MITKDNIRQLFDYRDGNLYWKIEPNYTVKIGDRSGGLRNGHIYETVKYKRKDYSIHRLIYLWHTGELPNLVDHINKNKTDNRIENLRAASKSTNALNSDYAKGSTGYRGVTKRGERYEARIRKNYKHIHIGVYDTPQEAHQAYEYARQQIMID